MKKLLTLMLFGVSTIFHAQELAEIFTYEEFIKNVKENHPITVRAELLRTKAEGAGQMARGGFDPKIEGAWGQKTFKEKNYYSLASGALKIPTWYGIEVKTGYDNNNGEFLNNSDFLPDAGLWNIGISVPLGKGLIIDNRRAALKKAKIFSQATEQERIIVLNELIYQASNAYLNWQIAEAKLRITEQGVSIAEQRFEGTKSSFINGDKPAIDTLESFIAIQTRSNDRLKALQEVENSRISLNNFLWLNGEVPLEIQNNIKPEEVSTAMWNEEMEVLFQNRNDILASHPELLLYDYKQQNLKVEQRLQKEDLKPDIRLGYNPLLATNNNGIPQNFNPSDYKFGASFNYPILQRKARGKLKMTDAKIRETQVDRSLKAQNIIVQLDMMQNNQNQFLEQFDLITSTIENYAKLLQAENIKFEIGESSVFLLNSRESKFLDGQYKAIELQKKILKNKYSYLFYSGSIYDLIVEKISDN